MSSAEAPERTARLQGSEEDINHRALARLMMALEAPLQTIPPSAPGTWLTAVRVGRFTAASCHFDRNSSYRGCAGEAAEIFAQDRTVPQGLLGAPDASPVDGLRRYAADIDPVLVAGRDLATGAAVAIPAGLCFHSVATPGPCVRSSGCAARPTAADAVTAGICEIIEHALVGHWLNGRPANLPTGALQPVRLDAGSRIARLRQGADAPQTFVAHLGTLWGVHAVVAWSHGPDGELPCMASAAAPSLTEAVDGALRELAQMEWGALQSPAHCAGPATWQDKASALEVMEPSTVRLSPAPVGLQQIIERMTAAGYRGLFVDMHREAGLSVTKTLIPDLVCELSPIN